MEPDERAEKKHSVSVLSACISELLSHIKYVTVYLYSRFTPPCVHAIFMLIFMNITNVGMSMSKLSQYQTDT